MLKKTLILLFTSLIVWNVSIGSSKGTTLETITNSNYKELVQKAIKHFDKNEYEQSKQEWEVLLKYARNTSNKLLEAKANKYLGNYYLSKIDYANAEKYYKAAQQIVEVLESSPEVDSLLADVYFNIANHRIVSKKHYKFKNPKKGLQTTLDYLNEAEALYKKQNNYKGIADCKNRKASWFVEIMDYDLALEEYEEAFKFFKLAQQQIKKTNHEYIIIQERLIANQYNIARIWYDQNKLIECETSLKEVLEKLEELETNQKDAKKYITNLKRLVYNKLGRIYYRFGAYNKARESFKLSQSQFVNQIDHLTIDNTTGLAEIFIQKGQFVEAKTVLDTLVKDFKIPSINTIKSDNCDNYHIATIMGTYGNYYYKKANYDNAYNYYFKALEIQRKFNFNRQVAVSINNIANALMQMEEKSPQEKINKIQEIINIIQNLYVEKSAEKTVLVSLPSFDSNNRDKSFSDAVYILYGALINKVCGIVSDKTDENQSIWITPKLNMAQVWYDIAIASDNKETKKEILLKALETLNSLDRFNPNTLQRLEIEYKRAKIYKALEKRQEYRNALQKAKEAIVKLQEEGISPIYITKEASSMNKLNDTENLLANFYQTYITEFATENNIDTLVFEATFYELQQTFFNEYANYNNSKIDDLIEEWYLANAKHSFNSPKAEKNANNIFEEIVQELSLQADYSNILPYFKVKPQDLQIIAKNFPINSVIVYPIITGNTVKTLVIFNPDSTNKNTILSKTFQGKSFQTTIQNIETLIDDEIKNTNGSKIAQLKEDTAKVYSFIFKDLFKYLETQQGIETIVFYPTKELGKVPATMLWDDSKKEYVLQKDYLIATMSGVSFYNVLAKNQKKETEINTVGAIFNSFPEFTSTTTRTKITLDNHFGDVLQTFKTKKEIDSFKNSPQSFDIVHLDGHALFNLDNPETSLINFKENTILLSEIRSLRKVVTGALIILSACETGKSKNAGADNVKSLAHEFEFAGANTLLASLWKVENLATTFILADFYNNLANQNNQNPLEALTKAQRKYLEKHTTGFQASPVAWGPFVVMGVW